MILLIILTSVFFLLIFYYLTGRYNENYWRKRGAAFYTDNKVTGPMWKFLRKNVALFELMQEIYTTHKDDPAVGIGQFLTPALFVIHPKNINHVLQTDFRSFYHRGVETYEKDLLADNILFMNGNRWKLMRQSMSPLFTANKLKSMYHVIDKSARDIVQFFDKDVSVRKGDLYENLNTFCSAAICAAVFGISSKSIFDSPFLDVAKNAFTPTLYRNIKFFLLSLKPDAAKKFKFSLFFEHEEFFIGAIKQLLREREKDTEKRHDFADICMKLQKNGMLKDKETGLELEPTDELLAAQAFFFFVAGVEPTATSLFAVLIELGRNPEPLKRTLDEIDEAFDKTNGQLNFETVNEMKYLDSVLSEALRMYPPIGFLTRLCTQDSVLPVGNVRVAKGTKIFTPIYGLHFDPRYYPNPHEFNPERFSEDTKIDDQLYMPFGMGSRVCIGARYARMQAKTGLIHLLRHYAPKTTVLEGGIKFNKQNIQVRPENMHVEMIPRKVKSY